MKWVIVLYFACGVNCGEPRTVQLNDTKYDKLKDCRDAGKVWLSSDANPTGAIKTFLCTRSP